MGHAAVNATMYHKMQLVRIIKIVLPVQLVPRILPSETCRTRLAEETPTPVSQQIQTLFECTEDGIVHDVNSIRYLAYIKVVFVAYWVCSLNYNYRHTSPTQ